MERCATAGRAVGAGFDNVARNACEAFRATISYLPHNSPLSVFVIPSYPAVIALRRGFSPEDENRALAIALGHILSFHESRDDYAYGSDFTPRWDRDGEYEEAKVFAEAFCGGVR